jgi:hypothetical protein
MSNFVQIKGMVDGFFATHAQQKQAMQSILIDIAIDLEKHGDTTACTYLLRQMEQSGGGLNNPAIVEWINRYTKVQIKFEKQQHIVEFQKHKVTKLDDGKANVWYSLKKQTNFTGFDFVQKIQADISTANKKLKERAALIEQGKKEDAALITIDRQLMQAIKLLTTSPQMVAMVLQQNELLTIGDSNQIQPDTHNNVAVAA